MKHRKRGIPLEMFGALMRRPNTFCLHQKCPYFATRKVWYFDPEFNITMYLYLCDKHHHSAPTSIEDVPLAKEARQANAAVYMVQAN